MTCSDFRKFDSKSAWLKKDPKIEILSPKESAIDLLLSSLRHIEGLDLQILSQKGFQIKEASLQSLMASDLILQKGSYIRLSKQGRFIADSIILEIIRNLKEIVH